MNLKTKILSGVISIAYILGCALPSYTSATNNTYTDSQCEVEQFDHMQFLRLWNIAMRNPVFAQELEDLIKNGKIILNIGDLRDYKDIENDESLDSILIAVYYFCILAQNDSMMINIAQQIRKNQIPTTPHMEELLTSPIPRNITF